ncbi:hypothetical protein F4861DRAFT_456422 [Xylaria intraflava]|nr:hypothetical protein F4861DRAFT_456422 [Xylaria intraflava]
MPQLHYISGPHFPLHSLQKSRGLRHAFAAVPQQRLVPERYQLLRCYRTVRATYRLSFFLLCRFGLCLCCLSVCLWCLPLPLPLTPTTGTYYHYYHYLDHYHYHSLVSTSYYRYLPIPYYHCLCRCRCRCRYFCLYLYCLLPLPLLLLLPTDRAGIFLSRHSGARSVNIHRPKPQPSRPLIHPSLPQFLALLADALYLASGHQCRSLVESSALYGEGKKKTKISTTAQPKAEVDHKRNTASLHHRLSLLPVSATDGSDVAGH